MKKNYPLNIKIDLECNNLINEILAKLNKETNFDFKKSDLIRVLLNRGLMEIKTGSIQSKELLFNTK
jgi:hypothetical protein